MFCRNLDKISMYSDSKHEECDDIILLQSPFMETTRSGRYLSSVVISLTPRKLIVKTAHDQNPIVQPEQSFPLDYFYPLETIKLSVFKKSQRQSIKLCYTATTRYFELRQWTKRQIFWKLWCIHVTELNSDKRMWPFLESRNASCYRTDADEKKKNTWTDKYLYLGSKRAAEDSNRPIPVPGLGPTEDIKLLYLKQKYFGCWDQSEHWVQCDSSLSSSIRY